MKNIGKLVGAGILSVIVMVICYPWPFIETEIWKESIKYSNVFFNGGNPFTNFYFVVWGKSAYYSASSAEPFSFWSNSFRILSETTLLLSICSFLYILYKYPAKWFILFLPFTIFMLHHAIRGGLAMGARQFYFLLPAAYIAIGAMLNDFSVFVLTKIHPIRLNSVPSQRLQLFTILPFFIQPVWWTFKYLSLTGNPTTQELGRQWINEHLTSKDIVLVNYAAPFTNISSWYAPADSMNNPIAVERKKRLPHFTVGQLEEFDYPKEVASNIHRYANVYVALSDYNSTIYYQYANCKLWGEHKYHYFTIKAAYFNEIYRNSIKVAEFNPKQCQALGPAITIYKIR